MSFWDYEDHFKYEKIIHSYLENFQHKIWYVELGDLWITSDKSNQLYSWNLKDEKPTLISSMHE